MHAFQIDHLVEQRIAARHTAADRHRLVGIARHARRIAATSPDRVERRFSTALFTDLGRV
jgi:hypothetical protein